MDQCALDRRSGAWRGHLRRCLLDDAAVLDDRGRERGYPNDDRYRRDHRRDHRRDGPRDHDHGSGHQPVDDSTLDPSSPSARYRLTIVNTWSERTHPGLVSALAHFSWLAGATHDSGFTLWSLGALASPGVVQMAETGVTDLLVDEVTAAIDAGHVGAALSWQHWSCPLATATTECGATSVEFEVALAHPRVSLASMLGPSPDLFIGVSSLPLLEDDQWIEHLELELFPYDGGTRSDHVH